MSRPGRPRGDNAVAAQTDNCAQRLSGRSQCRKAQAEGSPVSAPGRHGLEGASFVTQGEYRMSERGRIVGRTSDSAPLRMLGTQTDITERKHAEGVALELAERLRKIARHVPSMMFQFARRARFMELNVP